MRTIIYKRVLTLIFIFTLIGCNSFNGEEIKSIRLECADLCADKGLTAAPFTERTYQDASEIKRFERAIDKAEKMSGDLDYGVYFLMYVTYKDASEKKYVLNIVNSEKEGIQGLLVDTADSMQGYSIPEAQHDELRKLIYEQN